MSNGRQDQQRDLDDQRILFDKVIALIEIQRQADPAILNFDRRPYAFSLNRHGHLLTYQQGPGAKIASGEIQPPPHPDHDRPFRFVVTRSAVEGRFELNDGPMQDLDDVAREIVGVFLQTTEQ